MEGLPKDILRCLLMDYLPLSDAIQCFLTIRIFNECCDPITKAEFKRKYFYHLTDYAPEEPCIWTGVDRGSGKERVCTCGVVYRNAHHSGRCWGSPLPTLCPDCGKLLRYPDQFLIHEELVYHGHFKKKHLYCTAHSPSLRAICVSRRKKQRRILPQVPSPLASVTFGTMALLTPLIGITITAVLAWRIGRLL